VAAALSAGPLQARLAALDLLREWLAPVDGLDPWRPDTLAADRLKAVTEWSTHPPVDLPPKPIAPAALAAARLDMDRLASVTDIEAAAIRERLARHGPSLMSEVYARLKSPPTDQARERLTALRYRLVAADALVLNWPGGLERLASDDPRFRHAAIQELAHRAGPAEEALLLELFSSPDALVRELSLRILHATVGRQSTAALVKLLGDPEPNVRAAVLKQLADQPTPTMISQLAAYIGQETDADLVVHAVRAVRAVETEEALNVLKPLTKHAAWRVRAEAATAVGEAATSYRQPQMSEPMKTAAFATLIEALNDSDGFVVSRAIAALKKGVRPEAVEPLAKLVDRAEPLLAAQAVKALNTGAQTRNAALPHVKRFCSHKEPAVRAAAIKELCMMVGVAAQVELPAALKDSAGQVRIAGAEALLQILNSTRSGGEGEVANLLDSSVHSLPIPPPPPPQPAMKSGGLFDGLIELFGGSTAVPPPQQPPAAIPETPPQPTDPDKVLAELRGGKARPAWMQDLIPLLTTMLPANDPEERLAAALALNALGRDEVALPVILDLAAKVRVLRGRAGSALPWLPWAKREDTYNRFVALNPDAEHLEEIVRGLTTLPDQRTVPLLWALSARGGLSNDLLELVFERLQSAYFGHNLYSRTNGNRNIRPADRKRAAADAAPKAATGPEQQRLIALAVLASADREAAALAAEKVVADAAAPDRLRRDAFQIRLAALPPTERLTAARQGLAHSFAGARRVAVEVLALESDYALLVIPNRGLRLDIDGADAIAQPRPALDRPFVPERPKDLTVETIRPLLADPDPATAAAAGYLLTLFGDAAGFDPLTHYWREYAPKDYAWTRLVCRAIVALDDDARVRVLEEVYENLSAIGLDPKEFYWTIRALDGPRALRLRRVIRSEHGMENLRNGSPNAIRD
jgi:HEAT repeat protein